MALVVVDKATAHLQVGTCLVSLRAISLTCIAAETAKGHESINKLFARL